MKNAGVELKLHLFLTSTLDTCEWPTSCLRRFMSGKEHLTHWIEGWVDRSVVLDVLKREKCLLLPEFKLGTFQAAV